MIEALRSNEFSVCVSRAAHAQIAARLKTKSRIQVRGHLTKYREKLRRTALSLGRAEDDFEDLIDKC